MLRDEAFALKAASLVDGRINWVVSQRAHTHTLTQTIRKEFRLNKDVIKISNKHKGSIGRGSYLGNEGCKHGHSNALCCVSACVQIKCARAHTRMSKRQAIL